MDITQENIFILCRLAYDGAKDDAGRAFANGMTAAYQKAFQQVARDNQEQAQKQAVAKIDAAASQGREQAMADMLRQVKEQNEADLAEQVAATAAPAALAPVEQNGYAAVEKGMV